MAETFNKKEREKKRELKRKEKLQKKEFRKENAGGSTGWESMMAYVDENGVIRDTPPDPTAKKEVKAKNIEIGVPKREKEDFDPTLTGKVHEEGIIRIS